MFENHSMKLRRGLHVTTRQLNAALASSLRYLLRNSGGVLIAKVEETSSAYERGLRVGDVLLEVQQDPVSTPEEAIERIDESRKQDRAAVLLMVSREGSPRFVAVEFTK